MAEVPDIGDHDLDFLTRLIRHPISGLVYRRRFEMVMDLAAPFERAKVLEIGYGAGFLAYSFAPACGEYHGVDIHTRPGVVADVLARQGVGGLQLRTGDACELADYADGSFDMVVSVSCLEHIRAQDRVQAQVRRVLRPGGRAVYGMPAKNIVTRLLFKMVGYDDSVIHPTTGPDVIAAATAAGLSLEKQLFLPPLFGHHCSLYWAGRFQKR